MSQSHWTRLFALFTACLIGSAVSTTGSDKKPKHPKKTKQAEELFGNPEILHLKIEIPPEGIAILEKYQFQFGAEQPERQSVPATVREGSNSYTNVAIHLKGAAGSFRPIGENPALTLNFDKLADGQRFHGLSKISLNNSVQDPTLASEEFSRDLFLKAGVAVPRATEVTVELNGRDLGPYVLVEGFNRQFLKRHFKNTDGNLYDGGFVKDINQTLAVNSGEKPQDQSDRVALAEAAAEPDLTNRLVRLQKILDIERFLTYVALDVMLWDWDGYPQNRNNWRLFHDTSTGKMIFIPHGLDQMLWKPEGSIFPPMQGLVAKGVLEIPELRSRYFAKIKELRNTVFNVQSMTNKVMAIAAKTNPILKQKDPERAKAQMKSVADFCDALVHRASSIDEQLATPITPLKFDSSGSAALPRWESKADFGHLEMKRDSINGTEILQLSANAGSSIGSWRSKVWLEAGRYRLDAKMKTSGIVPDLGDTRAGAGLRAANKRPEKFSTADSDWSDVSQEFSVEDSLREVQLLCEFRGAKGEASFQSIRLTRLPPKTP